MYPKEIFTMNVLSKKEKEMSNEFKTSNENKKPLKAILILGGVVIVCIIASIVGGMVYMQKLEEKKYEGMAKQQLGDIEFYKYVIWPGTITDTSFLLYPGDSDDRTFVAYCEEVSDEAQATIDDGEFTVAEVYNMLAENIVASAAEDAELISAELIEVDGNEAMEAYVKAQGTADFFQHYVYFLYEQKLYYFLLNEINGFMYESEFESIINSIDLNGDGKIETEYRLNKNISESLTLVIEEEEASEIELDFDELLEE